MRRRGKKGKKCRRLKWTPPYLMNRIFSTVFSIYYTIRRSHCKKGIQVAHKDHRIPVNEMGIHDYAFLTFSIVFNPYVLCSQIFLWSSGETENQTNFRSLPASSVLCADCRRTWRWPQKNFGVEGGQAKLSLL